uniref:ribonuclease H n=1 Tax=Plectus sambesii TaxID=2011161 RepID=A0A914XJM7_9BILA
MIARRGLRLFRNRATFDVLVGRLSSGDNPSCSSLPSISQLWLAQIKNDSDTPIVYTDGACKFNGQNAAVGGIGVYWGPDSPLNVSEPLTGVQTNNRAELQAVATALRQAVSLKYERVILRSDSQFLINSLSKWSSTWRRNGWKTVKGTDVKNRQDFEEILELMDKIQVEFEHVEGHSNESGNDEADRLANEGVLKQ